MTINVTITKPGVTDQFGRAMTVGTTYAVEDNFGLSLIGQLKATDTGNSLVTPGITQDDPLSIQVAGAIQASTLQSLLDMPIDQLAGMIGEPDGDETNVAAKQPATPMQ